MQRGIIIQPLENKIIVNMSLQRVDESMRPVPETKKRMIRLKFQNKSIEEYILVQDEDPSIPVDEGDNDSVCTLTVCENSEPPQMQELQRIVEASHNKLKS